MEALEVTKVVTISMEEAVKAIRNEMALEHIRQYCIDELRKDKSQYVDANMILRFMSGTDRQQTQKATIK